MSTVTLPEELVKELRTALDFISYSNEDDSVGYRPCCQVSSYDPHEVNCPIGKLQKLVQEAA